VLKGTRFGCGEEKQEEGTLLDLGKKHMGQQGEKEEGESPI